MHATSHPSESPFLVRRVPLTRPFIWISRGWEDMKDHPLPSLAYGALVSVMGAVVLLFNRHPYMIAATITAFMLIGPILGAGLCELSRRRDTGAVRDFEASLKALKHNQAGLLGFAKGLLLVGVVWILLSTMLLSVTIGNIAPSLADTIWGDVLQKITTAQALSYLVAGGVLAVVVFSVSVVSVPMIVDLSATASDAVATSLRVTLRDLPAMVVWSALIAVLTAIGFATMLVGMVVIYPLIGHATWYAYRDLVH